MLPYLLMIGLSALFALAGVRRSGVALVLVGVVYWLMVGFRFHVGMDWVNYLNLYVMSKNRSLADLMWQAEPAYHLLQWVARWTGGGYLLVNAVAGMIFCWGFIALARTFREPFLAVVVATPLLVVAFAMSGTRQSMAMGIIFYLYATWDRRRAVGRMALVLLASLFHFSAIFILVFVSLAAKTSPLARVAGAVAASLVLLLFLSASPDVLEVYSELYVSGPRRVDAPGAIVQVGVLAAAAMAYFLVRNRWIRVNGRSPLYEYLALAALLAVPTTQISSVGAYRFALYLWPMAMYVASDMVALLAGAQVRFLYRSMIATASVVLLVSWLSISNTGYAWLPYQNWLLQPDHASIGRAPR